MSTYYLDTSAALKLIVAESHSTPFAAFYDEHADSTWVSSALLRVEVMRAVVRALPEARPEAGELFLALNFVSVDDEIIDGAMSEPDPMLPSPDAIHLATARAFGTDLDGIATYDDRLTAAALSAGMAIVSPRDR